MSVTREAAHPELQPCPLCGGGASFAEPIAGDLMKFAFCAACDFSGPRHKTRLGAVAAWNRRDKMTDWRPIETAPKDGTPILAFGRAKGLTVMKWHQPGNPKANGFWTGGNHSVCPTHWMPLPEPPP